MKATTILKQNITTLLRRRGQTRHDLAHWCRRSDAWLSKLLSDENRNVPVKYFDRISDFFGIQTYQLFQPGISHLTERRKGADRRCGDDRRIGVTARARPTTERRGLTLTVEDEAVIADMHALDYEAYQKVRAWIAVTKLARSTEPETSIRHEPTQAGPRTTGPMTRTLATVKRSPPPLKTSKQPAPNDD